MMSINSSPSVVAWNDYCNNHWFIYKHSVGRFMENGKERGGPASNGYRRLMLNGISYLEHRLVWLIFEGDIPDGYEIDHIDGDRANNRRTNLRLVTRQQNNMNCGDSKNSTSGIKGVSWHDERNKWRAYIMIDYRQKHLGLFDTKEEAKAARVAAEHLLFGEYRREETH